MLKKIILMLVIASLLVTPVSAEETAGEASTVLTHEQEMLVALDIMSPDSYGLLDNAKEITRVEFASSIAKIIDINPTVVATSTYYDDVAADGWAAHTLNNLVDMKILNVPENKLFRPNDKILYSESVKMLVCLLGYGNYAENMGGYPTGYLAAANRIDLTDGVAASQYVTNGTLSTLLYNALHTKMLDIESIGAEIEYTNTTGTTLLSNYHNISMTEGVVEAVEGLTLTGKETSYGKCIIGGESFFTDNSNANSLIGHFVKAYYEDNGENSKRLIYLDAYENETFTILSDDYVDYDNGEITFYNDKERKKTEKISLSGTVVKNGSVVTKDLDKSFDITNGEIRLVDNDTDGKYDVVFIEDYQTIVVKSISLNTMIIVDDIEDKNAIDLSSDAVDYVFVYNPQGNEATVESIKAGMVIDVGIGENSAVIYINSNTFEGTIDALNTSSKKAEIDGVTYSYQSASYERYSMAASKKGIFKTNKYGDIAYFEEGEVANLQGYLIDTDESKGLGSTELLKILTKDGTVQIFETASSVKIDGDKYVNNVNQALEKAKNNVIIYSVNSEGKINYIDTHIKGKNEDDATLQLMGLTAPDVVADRWAATVNKFGKKFLMSSDAVMFRVPANPQVANDEDYGVDLLSTLVDNRGYDAKIYKTGHTAECNMVAVIGSAYKLDDYSPFYWVKEVRRGTTNSGETVTRLIVYERGAEKTIDIEDGYNIIPGVGDIIRAGLSTRNTCAMIETHYDYDTRKAGAVDPMAPFAGYDLTYRWKNFQDLQNYNRLVVGHAISVEGDVLRIGVDDIGSENFDEVFKIASSIPVIIYDEEEEEFISGGLGDIMPSEIYGVDCSEILIYTRYAKPLAVYVMNNRDKTGLPLQ